MKIYQKINKRKSTGVVKKYKLLGITCFSKEKTSDCVKYSLFHLNLSCTDWKMSFFSFQTAFSI